MLLNILLNPKLLIATSNNPDGTLSKLANLKALRQPDQNVLVKKFNTLFFIGVATYTAYNSFFFSELYVKFQKKVGDKSYNLTYCSLLQPTIHNFSETESKFSASFWDYVTGGWKFRGMVCVCFTRSYVRIFISMGIFFSQQKISFFLISKKKFCLKSFEDPRPKIFIFLRLDKDSRNIFVNTREGNWFLIMLLIHIRIG